MSRRLWRKNESDLTYYEVLGLQKNCSFNDIKKAFVELSKEHHPDVPGGDTEVSKRINVAYSVLSRPDERRKYDARIQTVTWRPNPVDETEVPRPATVEEIYKMYGFAGVAKNYSYAGRYPKSLMTAFVVFLLSGMTMSFLLTQRDLTKPLDPDEYSADEHDTYMAGGDFVARRAARQHRRIRDRTRQHGTFDKQLRFVEKIVLKTDAGDKK